jgi:hypothetical protein
MQRAVTTIYWFLVGLVVVVTLAAAGNVQALAKVYALLAPALQPFAALPWVQAVAAQGDKFPLAEAQAVLALTGFTLIFGTACIGAIPTFRRVVGYLGTDLVSLCAALRTQFPLGVFVLPDWRPATKTPLLQLSPGDEVFIQRRTGRIDELLMKYYTHPRRLPYSLLQLSLVASFFLLPGLLSGWIHTSPVVFFFGRLIVPGLAVMCCFDLLLLLLASCSRALSTRRLNPEV